jgi:hypothetical protein
MPNPLEVAEPRRSYWGYPRREAVANAAHRVVAGHEIRLVVLPAFLVVRDIRGAIRRLEVER